MVVIGNNMERINHLDFLKALAIILVIWGHAIQALDNNFFQNPLWELIYSFHMPLFAFLSGYFATNSVRMTMVDFLKKRSIQLLLPVMVWSIVLLILKIILYRPEHYMGIIKPSFQYDFWFIKCIFICALLMFFLFKYLSYKLCAVGFFFILCVWLCFLHIGNLFWTSFLLPIFGIGWMWRYVCEKSMGGVKKHLLIVSALIFSLLYFRWSGNYSIYVENIIWWQNGEFNVHNILITFLRATLGVSASFFLFEFSSRIYRYLPCGIACACCEIGKRTMGIYIVQCFVFDYWTLVIPKDKIEGSWIEILIFTIIALALSFGTVKLLEKYSWTACLFLGKMK